MQPTQDAESKLIQQRKKDHIDICLNKDVEPLKSPLGTSTVFDRWLLPYTSMPEIDLAKVQTEVDFFDWRIAMPFVVSSMTGGEAHGRTINENLAIACNRERVPFGLGSMRIVNRYPTSAYTFDVKKFCPDVPMFANVGLVQLNPNRGEKGWTHVEVNNLINCVKADGLFVHLNHTQEVCQPEGDTNFENLFNKFLLEIVPHVKVPIIVKGVGHGIERKWVQKFHDAGVKVVDVSGTGGTSWAWIEGRRQPNYNRTTEPTNLGYLLRDTGIPTDACLLQSRDIPGVKLMAGGGVRSGIDIGKALCLGASYATAAMPFLEAAMDSADAVQKLLQRYKTELRAAMFACGAIDIETMRAMKLVHRGSI